MSFRRSNFGEGQVSDLRQRGLVSSRKKQSALDLGLQDTVLRSQIFVPHQQFLIDGAGDVGQHASPVHSRASLKLIVEPGLYMLLRFQKAAGRGNYETGNQAFSKRLRFLTIREVSVVGYFESKPEAGSSSPLIEESDIQLATQYSSKAEDARTEQQDAAGLRSPLGRAGQRERFRGNRANGVLIGRGRSTVLIPVDRGVHRAAGGGAGVGQGHVALRERPYDDDASKACLVQGKTIRVRDRKSTRLNSI